MFDPRNVHKNYISSTLLSLNPLHLYHPSLQDLPICTVPSPLRPFRLPPSPRSPAEAMGLYKSYAQKAVNRSREALESQGQIRLALNAVEPP